MRLENLGLVALQLGRRNVRCFHTGRWFRLIRRPHPNALPRDDTPRPLFICPYLEETVRVTLGGHLCGRRARTLQMRENSAVCRNGDHVDVFDMNVRVRLSRRLIPRRDCPRWSNRDVIATIELLAALTGLERREACFLALDNCVGRLR